MLLPVASGDTFDFRTPGNMLFFLLICVLISFLLKVFLLLTYSKCLSRPAGIEVYESSVTV